MTEHKYKLLKEWLEHDRGARVLLFITFSAIIGLGILIGALMFKDSKYEQGVHDGQLKSLNVMIDIADAAMKDTTKVQCIDFYVNKDTIHVPVWSKAIKCKTK